MLHKLAEARGEARKLRIGTSVYDPTLKHFVLTVRSLSYYLLLYVCYSLMCVFNKFGGWGRRGLASVYVCVFNYALSEKIKG